MVYMEDGMKTIKISEGFDKPHRANKSNSRNRKRDPRANAALLGKIKGDGERNDIDEFGSSIDYFKMLNSSNHDNTKELSIESHPTTSDSSTPKIVPLDTNGNQLSSIKDSVAVSKEIALSPRDIAPDDTSHNKVDDIPIKTESFDESVVCMPLHDNPNDIYSVDDNNVPLEKTTLNPDPPYGILRKGNKPTYRSWKKTRSLRDRVPDNNQPIDNSGKKMICASTNKTMRHSIGIDGRKIRILLKNINLKKNIDKEITSIKKHSIANIKRTLKRNNIIKTGTTAPIGMLRGIYENCTLAGKIVNKSSDVLIHNFMNDK